MPTINGYWRFSPDRPETRPHKPATTYPQELSTSRQRHACCRLLLTDVDRPLFLETDPDNIFVGHKLSAGGIPRVSAIAAVNRQPRSTRTRCRLRQPRSTRTGCLLPQFTGVVRLGKRAGCAQPSSRTPQADAISGDEQQHARAQQGPGLRKAVEGRQLHGVEPSRVRIRQRN